MTYAPPVMSTLSSRTPIRRLSPTCSAVPVSRLMYLSAEPQRSVLSRSAAVLAGTLMLSSLCSAQALTGREMISGLARVLDGDTLEIGAVRVRIFGIDAPEGAQTCEGGQGRWECGKRATAALRRLTAGKQVECKGRDLDAYGRLLAVCHVKGVDVGEAMVRQGLAWAFVRYSDVYSASEKVARAERRGVFAVETSPPWEFRAERWEGAAQTAQADRARACPIKGNFSRSGSRIYHLPWQASYARTKINERAGERWFCDEGEAERAGWRRAR